MYLSYAKEIFKNTHVKVGTYTNYTYYSIIGREFRLQIWGCQSYKGPFVAHCITESK